MQPELPPVTDPVQALILERLDQTIRSLDEHRQNMRERLDVIKVAVEAKGSELDRKIEDVKKDVKANSDFVANARFGFKMLMWIGGPLAGMVSAWAVAMSKFKIGA